MSQRKWKLIKWGTGLLSLYLDWRLRKPKQRRTPDVCLVDSLMARLIPKLSFESFSENELRQYLESTAYTAFWHGTGRWQYDQQGKTVDVLEQMLKQGGMRPFKDIFDIKHGEMLSTSVARHRMYARIYGDMHQYKGANLQERYGSPRFWAYYFIMAINLHATKELGLWNPKARRGQHAVWRKQGKEIWAVKVHQNPGEATGKFFDNGSDIPGNYPIIVGIKRANHTLLETADYVARYESRISSNIPVETFTHLEVPRHKVIGIQKLLKKYGYVDVPVFVFEQCERYYASKHFSELVFRSKG